MVDTDSSRRFKRSFTYRPCRAACRLPALRGRRAARPPSDHATTHSTTGERSNRRAAHHLGSKPRRTGDKRVTSSIKISRHNPEWQTNHKGASRFGESDGTARGARKAYLSVLDTARAGREVIVRLTGTPHFAEFLGFCDLINSVATVPTKFVVRAIWPSGGAQSQCFGADDVFRSPAQSYQFRCMFVSAGRRAFRVACGSACLYTNFRSKLVESRNCPALCFEPLLPALL